MAAHVWNGSTWLPIKRMPTWDGSFWVSGNRYVWNGSSWVGFQDDITLSFEQVVASADASGQTLRATWSIDPAGLTPTVTSTGQVVAPVQQFPSYFNSYEWNNNASNSGQYQIFVTASGGVSSGTLNTWLDLTSTRSWYIQANFDRVTTLTITIRNKITQQTFASQVVDLEIITFN